jgi:2-dehydropantoate 2-reductase
MQEIKSVAILGAGAMGAYLARLFYRNADFKTQVIARGQRAARLRQNGLVVNGERFHVTVADPDVVEEYVDLVIVAFKHAALSEALEDLQHFIGSETLIISVMNGLDSEEIIAARYGWKHVLFCVAFGMDALRTGEEVQVTNIGKLCIGEESNLVPNARVLRVQQAFQKAGMPCEVPVDMVRTMWWKFMINVGVNQAAAIMRVPFGVFQRESDARAVMQLLMREVIALAQSKGINLQEHDLKGWDTILNTLSAQGKPSMLQDIEAGRKTEVDIFAAKVVAFGRDCGIPTPVNETVLHIIKTIERHPLLLNG